MRPNMVIQLTAMALTLVGLTMVLWMEVPPWQRKMAAQIARTRIRQAAARLAVASGHRAMGRELAGTPQEIAGYGRTERLSRLRDSL